jgi:type IV pilus assembly protein PilN
LQDEISALKARQEAVENLQADRNMPVRLLNEAVRQLPDGVYLKSLKQENQNVLLQGLAQSNERVSELLRNLSRNSEWIATPELVGINAANVALLGSKQPQRVFDFTVRVQLRRASDVAAAQTASAASAAKSAAAQKGV